ncbi:MAG: choice-of-anchor D domain-containing protein [Planctomycetes bacterium]|nr:choice-of-anchor D domain-containing protein [Planctomycetota bacterium]
MRFIIFTLLCVFALFSCDTDNEKLFYAEKSIMDFGSVGINSIVELDTKIVNNSSEDVRIAEFVITGESALEFDFVSGNVPVNVTANGGEHVVSVAFNPVDDVGKREAKIEIFDSANEIQLVLKLRGKATAEPLMTVDSQTLNFNEILLGQSKTEDVSIKNEGIATLIIESAEITGTNKGEFSLLRSFINETIDLSESALIQVICNPQYIGNKNAVLVLYHNAPNFENPLRCLLVATVNNAAPVFSANTNNINFSGVKINTSVVKTLEITNAGTADLSILSIIFSGSGKEAYSIKSGRAPYIVVPGDLKTIEIEFEPEVVGNFEADLIIAYNDVNSPAIVHLKGTGILSKNVIFSEDWDGLGSFPFAWTITDGGTGGTNFYKTWFLENGTHDENLTPGSGNCASCSAYLAGSNITLEEFLTSPAIDCSAYTSGNIFLELDGNFQRYENNSYADKARIEVFDGNLWRLIAEYLTDWQNFYYGQHKIYDISQYALGNADMKVRFYYSGQYDWFFQVDNIEIVHTP